MAEATVQRSRRNLQEDVAPTASKGNSFAQDKAVMENHPSGIRQKQNVILQPTSSIRKSLVDKLGHFRTLQDSKVVGLDRAALSKSTRKKRFRLDGVPPDGEVDDEEWKRNLLEGTSVEMMENQVRKEEIRNPFRLFLLGTVAAIKIFGFYLINLESLVTIGKKFFESRFATTGFVLISFPLFQ